MTAFRWPSATPAGTDVVLIARVTFQLTAGPPRPGRRGITLRKGVSTGYCVCAGARRSKNVRPVATLMPAFLSCATERGSLNAARHWSKVSFVSTGAVMGDGSKRSDGGGHTRAAPCVPNGLTVQLADVDRPALAERPLHQLLGVVRVLGVERLLFLLPGPRLRHLLLLRELDHGALGGSWRGFEFRDALLERCNLGEGGVALAGDLHELVAPLLEFGLRCLRGLVAVVAVSAHRGGVIVDRLHAVLVGGGHFLRERVSELLDRGVHEILSLDGGAGGLVRLSAGWAVFVDLVLPRGDDLALDARDIGRTVLARVVGVVDVAPRGADMLFVVDRVLLVGGIGVLHVAVLVLAVLRRHVAAFGDLEERVLDDA